MGYLGNDLKVAYSTYKNIDDISGSFNGSTTSFSLLVGGVAPSPLPLNSQQCLISVGGVVQRPDDTGAEGFRLSGGNIVFSSAPGTGEDFFGIILAGADYVNVGANFPSGSAAVPSITFDSDLDTGIYNSAANQVSIATAGTERLRIDSAGQIESVSLGSASAPAFSFTTDPNTGVYSPGADQVAISTNGAGRLFVDSSGRLLVGTATARSNIYMGGASDTPKFQFEASGNDYSGQVSLIQYTSAGTAPTYTLGISKSNTPGTNAVVASGDTLGTINFVGNDGTNFRTAAQIQASVDGTPGANDMPGRIVLSTTADGASSPTERMRIDSSGRVGIGTTSPGVTLHLNATNPGIRLEDSDASGTPFAEIFGSSGNLILQADAGAEIASSNIQFLVDGNEAARIDDSRRLLVGTSSARTNFHNNATYTTQFQIEGTNFQNSAASLVCNSTDDAESASIAFAKSGGSTIGSNTLVSNGELLGELRFEGSDGSEFVQGAGIFAYVDGTPGANDMPSRLVFATTADGASNPTERMRIDKDGVATFTKAGGVGVTIGGVTSESIFRNQSGMAGIHFSTASVLPTDGTGTVVDNSRSLGSAGTRWSVVFAGTGTINTSDAILKQDIQALEESELKVATSIKSLIKRFRFIDAVASKGDGARIHIGVIAQEVEQSFIDEGLDPRRYALFCEDTLKDGSKRLGIRYDELLAFVIAAL